MALRHPHHAVGVRDAAAGSSSLDATKRALAVFFQRDPRDTHLPARRSDETRSAWPLEARIWDCVNPWPLTRSEWRAVADRTRVPALDVEIVCSGAGEHRRRVETRATDIVGHRLPTWQEVVERDYRPWDVERIVIDTARLSVEQSVRTILAEVPADR
jgi:hypothetical protein